MRLRGVMTIVLLDSISTGKIGWSPSDGFLEASMGTSLVSEFISSFGDNWKEMSMVKAFEVWCTYRI